MECDLGISCTLLLSCIFEFFIAVSIIGKDLIYGDIETFTGLANYLKISINLKDSFNSDNYTSFFNNSKFNDGSEIEFNFEVSDLNNESVTLKFTKRVYI